MAFDNTSYMTDLATKAQNLGNTGYTGFGQSTQVAANPMQQNAWQATYNRGVNGAQEVSDGRTQLQNTINGVGFSSNPYLQGENPYLQSSIDSALGDVTRNYNNVIKPQTESAMVGSGSFGNSGLQQLQGQQQTDLAKTMGNTASNMRFADYQQRADLYENERNRQMQATAAAPSYAASDYTDLQAMQQAGDSLQAQQQGERTAAYNQYLDAREWPFKTTGAQASAMNAGSVGGSTYQQQDPNKAASGVGGALAGAQLGGLISDGSGGNYSGWGAIGGGLLGLLG